MTLFKFGSRVELELPRLVVFSRTDREDPQDKHAFADPLFLEFSRLRTTPARARHVRVWKPDATTSLPKGSATLLPPGPPHDVKYAAHAT
jgi:hypothetical protein